FRTGQRPARARTAHSVLHEIAAGALDYAGRDGQAVGERAIVVQEPRVLDQVGGSLLDGRGRLRIETMAHDHAAQALRDRASARATEQLHELVLDPAFRLRCAVLVKGVRRAPQVFERVHDVEHDGDLRSDLARGTLDALDLIALTVEQDD